MKSVVLIAALIAIAAAGNCRAVLYSDRACKNQVGEIPADGSTCHVAHLEGAQLGLTLRDLGGGVGEQDLWKSTSCGGQPDDRFEFDFDDECLDVPEEVPDTYIDDILFHASKLTCK